MASGVVSSAPARLIRTLREVRLSRGYNHYYYTKSGLLVADRYTNARSSMMLPWFRELVADRSVLDLGSANGYFSLMAALAGARDVTGYERNKGLREDARKVARRMELQNVRFEDASIYDLGADQKRDVVLAMAIIHWFKSSQRPRFQDLGGALDYLLELTGETLFVEHIAPEDPTFFAEKDTGDVPTYDLDQFRRDVFEKCLRDRFGRVEYLGDPRPTRSLFLATRA